MNEQEKREYLQEQMEYYLFLALRQKEVNHDKYLYYLAKADNYKKLLEKAESEGTRDA